MGMGWGLGVGVGGGGEDGAGVLLTGFVAAQNLTQKEISLK